MKKTAASQLKPLIDAGFDLIPLPPREKAPRDKGWPDRGYEDFDPVAHMNHGGNVGVRLRRDHLVVDVDKKNGGLEALKRLCADIGVELLDWAHVVTGGGGYHIYMLKPAGMDLVGSLKKYPGIDFKSSGQVVAPGSVHPNGERYEWDALNVLTGTPAHAPAKLLDIIERKQIAANDSRKRDDDDIEAEALADMLEALDPADFRAHDEWLELMMACHESTGGAGADEFISWSISDPEYANQANVIRERWRGLKCSGGVTRATLGRRAAKPRSSGAVRASQERRAACLPATTGAKRTEQPSNRRPREVLVRCRHAWRRPWPDDYWSGQNWAGPQTNWRA